MTAWFIAALVWRLLVFCFIVVFIARMISGFRARMTETLDAARRGQLPSTLIREP